MSSSDGLVCRGCGQKHNKTNWEYTERVFRAALGLKALPEEAIKEPTGSTFSLNVFAHKQAKKRSDTLENLTWNDYQFWVYQQAHQVNQKGLLGVANYSKNGGRLEVDMDHASRFYFDCDGAGTWERLEKVFKKAGIQAFFHESSSSVRKRVEGDYDLPLKWHCEIRLARTLPNPLAGLDPTSPEARHARREWKRKYKHGAAVLSALAGFVGIGAPTGAEKSCGFDATTAQMCQIRFLGARQNEGGLVPAMSFLEGKKALDWDLFLQATGYEEGSVQTTTPGALQTVRVPTPEGITEYQFSNAHEQVDAEIRDRISVRQFLATFCGYSSPHSGDGHYFCPIHHEAEDNRTFHVFNADVLGGREMWHCFGDCGGVTGDVVRLASLFWGCKRWEARNRLASHVGIDPKDYHTQFKIKLTGEPKEAKAPEAQLPEGKSKQKHVPRKAPPGLNYATLWAAKWAPSYQGEPIEFARAVTKVLIECGAGMTRPDRQAPQKEKTKLEILKKDKAATINLPVLASTLWPATGRHYRRYDNLLATVVEVWKRKQNNEPAVGRKKLRTLGTQAMFELAKALRRDGLDFREALKSLVGFGLTRGADKEWLDGLWEWMKAHPADNDWDDENELEEHEKWDARYTRFMNAIRRPGGCSQCEQTLKGEGDRDLGPTGSDGEATPLKRRLVCSTNSCVYCFMLQTISEMELLEELWKDRPREDEEGIFVVEAKGIEKLEHIQTIKKEVSKHSDPKLGIMGFGDDGKATLSYFVTSDEAAGVVQSSIIGGGYVANGKEMDVKYRKFKTVGDAVDTAIEAKISFHVHPRRLIEERRNEDLTEWLWWAVYKSPVRNPKNERALPWPTQVQIQERIKKNCGEGFEPDIFPGEVITYWLHHRETGYFLGKRKKIPFTLDQALDAMEINVGLRETLAAGGAARTA